MRHEHTKQQSSCCSVLVSAMIRVRRGCHAALNNGPPPPRRGINPERRFEQRAAGQGILAVPGGPHAEIRLVPANNAVVNIDYTVRNAGRISLYPGFGRLVSSPFAALSRAAVRQQRYIINCNRCLPTARSRAVGFAGIIEASPARH